MTWTASCCGRNRLSPQNTQYGWGTSISPILFTMAGCTSSTTTKRKAYLVAFDKWTGEEKLRIEREDEKTNYATPFIWQNEQRTELVTSGIGWARTYDLDGNLLWKLKGKSILAIPTPFAYDGTAAHLIAGHVVWGENPMYAIQPGRQGRYLAGSNRTTTNDYVVWTTQKAGPYHPTPIIYRRQLHVLYDRGFHDHVRPQDGR